MWGGLIKFVKTIPGLSVIGEVAEFAFNFTSSLADEMVKNIPGFESYRSEDPYKIRVNNQADAEKIQKEINNFIAPHLQSWWIQTQDQLVRDGTKIREELTKKIKNDIQEISNELSEYLGAELDINLNINDIQFPSFEFPGIDAQIKYQQEVYQRTRKEIRGGGWCDDYYEVDVPYQETKEFYEIDLQKTADSISFIIHQQTEINKQLLQRLIEKQIKDDFRNAEKQINDYINRFQSELELMLKKRQTQEEKAPEIIANLENQQARLTEYLQELTAIKEYLETWKPMKKMG